MAKKKDDKEKKGGFIDVFNIMKQLLFVLSVVSASLLTLCSLSVFVNPVRMPWLGVFQLLFPVFLISTVVLILLCLIFVRSRVWLPALLLLLNFFSIRNYIPFNIPAETPIGSIKVMTYNTMGFALGKTEKDGRDMMAKYIGDQDADIICLQETAIYPPYFTEKIEKEIKRGRTMYMDSVSNQTEDISPITCFSKYPIVGKKQLVRQTAAGTRRYPQCGELPPLVNGFVRRRKIRCLRNHPQRGQREGRGGEKECRHADHKNKHSIGETGRNGGESV